VSHEPRASSASEPITHTSLTLNSCRIDPWRNPVLAVLAKELSATKDEAADNLRASAKKANLAMYHLPLPDLLPPHKPTKLTAWTLGIDDTPAFAPGRADFDTSVDELHRKSANVLEQLSSNNGSIFTPTPFSPSAGLALRVVLSAYVDQRAVDYFFFPCADPRPPNVWTIVDASKPSLFCPQLRARSRYSSAVVRALRIDAL
jgi:hypothetical protein